MGNEKTTASILALLGAICGCAVDERAPDTVKTTVDGAPARIPRVEQLILAGVFVHSDSLVATAARARETHLLQVMVVPKYLVERQAEGAELYPYWWREENIYLNQCREDGRTVLSARCLDTAPKLASGHTSDGWPFSDDPSPLSVGLGVPQRRVHWESLIAAKYPTVRDQPNAPELLPTLGTVAGRVQTLKAARTNTGTRPPLWVFPFSGKSALFETVYGDWLRSAVELGSPVGIVDYGDNLGDRGNADAQRNTLIAMALRATTRSQEPRVRATAGGVESYECETHAASGRYFWFESAGQRRKIEVDLHEVFHGVPSPIDTPQPEDAGYPSSPEAAPKVGADADLDGITRATMTWLCQPGSRTRPRGREAAVELMTPASI